MNHIIQSTLPETLPEYTTAFINMQDERSLKLVLKTCGDECLLVARTDCRKILRPMRRILKKFKLVTVTPIVEDITHTGEVMMVFTRGSFNLPREPRIAYLGQSCLYASHYTVGNTVDLNCFGKNYHKRAKETDRSNTLVIEGDQ